MSPLSRTRTHSFDQQLEDNATKTLINLLEYSAPDLTRSFLKESLGVDIAQLDGGEIAYTLQGAPKAALAARRYLLGL